MKVSFKKENPDAKAPTYSVSGDACMDLYAVSSTSDNYGNIVYDTGIAMEIPENFVGLVFPRSSVSKTCLSLRNSVGVIDSGYRGTIKLKFYELNEGPDTNVKYNSGDRIGQLMILPRPEIEMVEVDDLSNTVRGSGGFGSTGN
jgi:dUTP pyrophosphatase